MKTSTGLLAAAILAAGIAAQADALAQASAPLGYPQLQDTVPPMAKYGRAYTPGWDQLTKDEQKKLGAQVRKLRSFDECQALMAEVKQRTDERARSKGAAAPAAPRRNACGELEPRR